MAVRKFHIDVVVQNGQLHEELHDEADRRLMMERLENILTNPAITKDLRDGVAQVLLDQFTNNNSHVPIIFRSGLEPGDDEEQLVWDCDHADLEVDIDKYRETPRTPHKIGPPGNPFKFSGGNKGKHVESGDHKNRGHSTEQKFYKFSLEGKDLLGNKVTLDPCIICEK